MAVQRRSATTASGDSAGPFRCSTASAARAEPMFATASRVERWLAVEQPGPWGPDSVPATRMDPVARDHLVRLAHRMRARLLLIRRPPDAAGQSGRQVFLAESRPGREWMMSRRVADEAELARLDMPARDHGWRDETAPLYLVCTHGRHDPCCALLGRPVANALRARVPERTWECSHVGGDRFGANVVVLPAGLYLGRVSPGRVDGLTDALAAGRIPLDLLRGRSSLSLPAQAAQHFARTADREYGPADRLDDLLPIGEEPVEPNGWRILLQSRTGPVAVTVRRMPGAAAHRLTCHAAEPKLFPGFELVALEVPAPN